MCVCFKFTLYPLMPKMLIVIILYNSKLLAFKFGNYNHQVVVWSHIFNTRDPKQLTKD